jgi:hypothetical protein
MRKNKKKKNNEIESYEEDIMTIASKEEELFDNYNDSEETSFEDEYVENSDESDNNIESSLSDNEEYETFDEEIDNYTEKKEKNYKKIINIVFGIIIVILVMITTDVICVARYNIGPFFAIPLHKYDDGGSKAYYGIGYKVIKYNQVQGRRDKEIGLWTLKYNIEPTTVQAIDLAIEFNDDEKATYEKYYKKFVRIIATLEKVDTKNNKITIGYTDEDGKYTLDIVCSMAEKNKISNLTENEEITIIGTVSDYDFKTSKKSSKLYISNCFAEQ